MNTPSTGASPAAQASSPTTTSTPSYFQADDQCSFDSCTRSAYARGLCTKHYQQQRRKALEDGTEGSKKKYPATACRLCGVKPLFVPKFQLCHKHYRLGTTVRYRTSMQLQHFFWREQASQLIAPVQLQLQQFVNRELLGDWDDWMRAWTQESATAGTEGVSTYEWELDEQIEHYLLTVLTSIGYSQETIAEIRDADLQTLTDNLMKSLPEGLSLRQIFLGAG